MVVTLNIENDTELRAYIKDCIKGQVLAITRGEFKTIVIEELEKKIKGSDNAGKFERMHKEATLQAVSNILYREHGVNSYSDRFIQPYVEAILDKVLVGKNWDKLVDDLAKAKVRELIK